MPASDQHARASGVIEVPPTGSPHVAGIHASTRGRWARVSALGFVTTLAALLASFPVRNSDLTMHLVLGRQLIHTGLAAGGGLEIVSGSRPYPAWLFDLLCYGVYSAFGGIGLVVTKVLLVVVLALVLFRLSRPPAGSFVAAACTALALVAMGARLRAQPATVSYLFLALTLYFLGPYRAALGRWRAVAIPVLFVLWASTDRGFVIGLGVVALFWLGHALDAWSQQPGRARRLVLPLVFIALLAGFYFLCVHGPLVPPEIASITSPLQSPAFAVLVRSPAGLAYFVLLIVGGCAWFADRTRWSWQRFLPWLGLALVSIANVRAIPLFAVAAAPALACSLQGARSAGRPAGRHVRRVVVGVLAAPAALGLLICAWPGWLQMPPFEPRSWHVALPATLERAADATRRWREQGTLPDAQRALHLVPETAYAFAWYNPQHQGLLDDRLAVALRDSTADPAAWGDRLRAARIDHVVVYDADRERLLVLLERLLRESEQWPLLFLDGDLAIFGWRDPMLRHGEAPDRFTGRVLDPNRLAFHGDAVKQAPRKRNGPGSAQSSWWDAFAGPTAIRSLDDDEAMLYLLCAEALQRSAPLRRAQGWQFSQSAGLVAAAGGGGVPQLPVGVTLRLALVRPPLPEKDGALPPLGAMVAAWQQGFAMAYDDVPAAVLYLAIRAARRALADHPDNAQAHLVLGESYLRLLHGTRERLWGRRLPELVQLRRTQASTALNRAIALNPSLAQAHLSLARLYQDIGYVDLALDHLRTYQKLLRAPTGSAGTDPAMDALAQTLSRLTDAVAERGAAYEAEASSVRVLDRALAAYRHGLAATARDLLLDSDMAAFGPQGLRLELELLLRTGRSSAVVEWTSPEHKSSMGGATYHWLRIQALAAGGDYALAEAECDLLADDARGVQTLQPWQLIAAQVGQTVLDEQPVGATVGDLAWRAMNRVKMVNRTLSLAKDLRQVANARVFRGLLALEQGDMDEADVAFRLALALWQDDTAAAFGSGLDFNARPVAQTALQWLQ